MQRYLKVGYSGSNREPRESMISRIALRRVGLNKARVSAFRDVNGKRNRADSFGGQRR